MNINTISRVLIIFTLILTCFSLVPAFSDNSAADQKPSDVYLAYLKSAQSADSFDDITIYWAGWMSESFDRGSDEQKKARLERLKKSAANKNNIKVISTEKSGEFWIINLSSVYPDGQKMKGQVKMIRENGNLLIEEEMWTADFSDE